MLIPLGILAATAAGIADRFVAIGQGLTSRLIAYAFNDGFGTKFTDPASNPEGMGRVAFTPNGNQVGMAHFTTPFISAYEFTPSGFSFRYTNFGGTRGSDNVAIAFSSNTLAVVGGGGANVNTYAWSPGFGTRYSDPATAPGANSNAVDFNSTGTQIAIGHTTAPFISTYPFSAGFGSRYTNPSPALAGAVAGIVFTPNDADIIIAHANTPFISAFAWTGSGFGTRYSNPATLPPDFGRGIAVSPNGNDIVIITAGTNRVSAYPWSSGFGTRYSNPVTMPTGDTNAVNFSRSGKSVGVAHDTTPFVTVYPWASGFGSKYANPATAVLANSRGIDFA